jgi:hypothetical protein
MSRSNLEFDQAALRSEYHQRHGRDVGSYVYDAEIKRRAEQDARHAALSGELPAIDAKLSDLQHAAGIVQQQFAADREAAYRAVLAIDNKAASADQQAQSAIAVLQNKSGEMRREMSAIVLRREAEREVRAVATYNAPGRETARKDNAIAAATLAANSRNPGQHR